MRVDFLISFLLVSLIMLMRVNGVEFEGDRTSKLRRNKELENLITELNIHNHRGESVGSTKNVVDQKDLKKLDLKKIGFHLYTKLNKDTLQNLFINNNNTINSNFNSEHPTRFIAHGWKSQPSDLNLIRDAYLEIGEFNVVFVDWHEISDLPYHIACDKVIAISTHIAKTIDYLESQGKLNYDNTGLVGHSLGAHIIGLAGYYSEGIMNHVIGLDPALPMFGNARTGERISKRDAKYVQIIHTNAGILGFVRSIGHADFYTNYAGAWQFGCKGDPISSCSHGRSAEYFAESIKTPQGFRGTTADSYHDFRVGDYNDSPNKIYMGGANVDLNAVGKYYLYTNSDEPYARFSKSSVCPNLFNDSAVFVQEIEQSNYNEQ